MKTRHLIHFLLAIFWCAPCFAYEMGVVGGVQTTTVSAKAAGTSVDSGSGFHFGLIGFAEVNDQFSFRGGALYTQRKFSFTTSGIKSDVEIDYIEVPVTGLYMFNETAGLFGGLQFGVKMNDKCSVSGGATCTLDSVQSLTTGLDVGLHFRFIPNVGMEVSYLYGMSDLFGGSSGVEKASGLTASLVYLF